jgi:hypothetical protein
MPHVGRDSMLGCRKVWLTLMFLLVVAPNGRSYSQAFLFCDRTSTEIPQFSANFRTTAIFRRETASFDSRSLLRVQYYPQPYPQYYPPPQPAYEYQRGPYVPYQVPAQQARAAICATAAGSCQLAPSLFLLRGSQCSCGFATGIFFGIAQ